MPPEFFIVAHTFAAPFVSETLHEHRHALSAADALEQFVASEPHPAGIYAANAYHSADDFHKSGRPIARWMSNHAAACEGARSVLSHAPGNVVIDGKRVTVDNPTEGSVVDA